MNVRLYERYDINGNPIKMVSISDYDTIAERLKYYERAVEWVLNDMKYKAPEQVDHICAERWYLELSQAKKAADKIS